LASIGLELAHFAGLIGDAKRKIERIRAPCELARGMQSLWHRRTDGPPGTTGRMKMSSFSSFSQSLVSVFGAVVVGALFVVAAVGPAGVSLVA
jgi:hypothetical protein